MKLVYVLVLAVSLGSCLGSPSPDASDEFDSLELLQALRDEPRMMPQAYDYAFVSAKSIKISVQTLTGALFTLDVNTDDTVYNVKVKIEQQEGYAVNTQKLVYSGSPIKNDKTLSDYNIKDGANLYLLFQISSVCDRSKARQSSTFISTSIQIYVHTLTGGLFTLDVDTGNTVEEVKALIETQHGIPADEHRLIYNGKVLEYCLTLTDYNIQDGADITLQRMLSGGK